MKRTNTNITRFENGDFWIDIVDDGDCWEAWLQHKDYADSELVFGIPSENVSFEKVCKIVESNLAEYEAEYMASRQD